MGPFHGPVCSQLLHPPSLFSHCFPPPDPEQEHGSGAPTSHQWHCLSPAPNQTGSFPHGNSPTASQWRGSPFPSLPLHSTHPIYSHRSVDPISLLSLLAWTPPTFRKASRLLPGSVFYKSLVMTSSPGCSPWEHMEPGTPLRERDKTGQEADDGAGQEEETSPGSRICWLSLFLHRLVSNPYIPMVGWQWLCPSGVLGAQWGHPTFTGAEAVQDSHLGRGWRTPGGPRGPGAAQQSFVAQWPRVGRTVKLGGSSRRGRAFLTTAAPDPHPCTGRKPGPSCPRRKKEGEGCDTQHSPGVPSTQGATALP